MSEPKRIRYLIEPEHKKSAYEEQTWTNTLKNSKPVSLKVGNLYRWGSFNIDLSENEKKDIVKKETVLLNDYENFGSNKDKIRDLASTSICCLVTTNFCHFPKSSTN